MTKKFDRSALALWYPAEHQVGFGPSLHADSVTRARWLAVASNFLMLRFGHKPTWFLVDWERARSWAFPEGLEAEEHRFTLAETDFRCLRAMVDEAAVFDTMLRSSDVGWDAVALIDGSATLAEVQQLAVPWLVAVNEFASPIGAPFDFAFTSGDGLVLRWANATLSKGELEAGVYAAFGAGEVCSDC